MTSEDLGAAAFAIASSQTEVRSTNLFEVDLAPNGGIRIAQKA
jgi:hypothetical protein